MEALQVAVGVSVLFAPKLGVALMGGSMLSQYLQSRNRKKKAMQRQNASGSDEWVVVPPDRQAVVYPTQLRWSQITCLYTKQGQQEARVLLDNQSGQASPGRLLGIMGPSGSGKTTLLKILAGKLPFNNNLKLLGYITVNGHPITGNHYKQAYIPQEDIFYSQLTTRETIELAAQLQLPEGISESSRQQLVDNILLKMGLQSCEDTRVGDNKVRGISGGEKKRLSIACQLLGRPPLVLVDEPTTGLDAFQAYQVMQSLKQLASNGHTVVCSIHQPRSSIFAMFDDLLLLAEGKPVYFGPASEALLHFETLGYDCPEHYNPAEFMADLISVDYTQEEESRARIQHLCNTFTANDVPVEAELIKMNGEEEVAEEINGNEVVGLGKQFRLLLQRSWKQVKRDKTTIIIRAVTSVQTAFVFGSVWFRLRRRFSSTPSRLGLMQVVATYIGQTFIFKTLNVFLKEKTIVTRERSQNSYGVAPYLLSKTVAELPFNFLYPFLFTLPLYPLTGLYFTPRRFLNFVGLCTLDAFASTSLSLAIGAAAPSTDAALVLGPAISIIFVVFGGLYIKIDDVPTIWRWIPKISMITRAYEGLVLNEYKGTYLDPEEGDKIAKYCGNDVVEQVGFDGLSIRQVVGASMSILIFNYWLTYIILKAKKPKFQEIEEPLVEDYVQA
eukprot:TRINITY_DN2487_c0_g1_i1.p1 TRINITY_DN2487_c0_g1~~TRINITY_DN2487_c0_g1_i1.p1  ORF type:complete len:669 (-),score=93.36 TRINITY_DN2487_c0_g1_i1:376-2382(-)